jgi:hypothetical protein
MEKGDALIGRGIKVAKARIGLVSNNPSLISSPDYFEGIPHPAVVKGRGWLIHSQLANFQIFSVEYQPPPKLDSYFYILDYNIAESQIFLNNGNLVALGNWTALEREVVDKRYTLLGNLGLLFRFILVTLEKNHNIYSFHAAALYDESSNEMIIALGERGSGKSALMLSALDQGFFKLFATEILHAEVAGDRVIFYKGTLRNNVRAGHLIYDFPKIKERIGVEFAKLDNPWGTKVQVDLKDYGTEKDIIVDPKITIVFPRIEEFNKVSEYHYIKDKREIKRRLFENIHDRISSLGLIYEKIPVISLDNYTLMKNRLKFVESFIEVGRIEKAVSLFASPKNCLEGWLRD